MTYKPRKRWCRTCEGRGKVRNNRSENGSYILGFAKCDNCDGVGYFLSKQRIDKPQG